MGLLGDDDLMPTIRRGGNCRRRAKRDGAIPPCRQVSARPETDHLHLHTFLEYSPSDAEIDEYRKGSRPNPQPAVPDSELFEFENWGAQRCTKIPPKTVRPSADMGMYGIEQKPQESVDS